MNRLPQNPKEFVKLLLGTNIRDLYDMPKLIDHNISWEELDAWLIDNWPWLHQDCGFHSESSQDHITVKMENQVMYHFYKDFPHWREFYQAVTQNDN